MIFNPATQSKNDEFDLNNFSSADDQSKAQIFSVNLPFEDNIKYLVLATGDSRDEDEFVFSTVVPRVTGGQVQIDKSTVFYIPYGVMDYVNTPAGGVGLTIFYFILESHSGKIYINGEEIGNKESNQFYFGCYNPQMSDRSIILMMKPLS